MLSAHKTTVGQPGRRTWRKLLPEAAPAPPNGALPRRYSKERLSGVPCESQDPHVCPLSARSVELRVRSCAWLGSACTWVNSALL